jgi:hypothetical protein
MADFGGTSEASVWLPYFGGPRDGEGLSLGRGWEPPHNLVSDRWPDGYYELERGRVRYAWRFGNPRQRRRTDA